MKKKTGFGIRTLCRIKGRCRILKTLKWSSFFMSLIQFLCRLLILSFIRLTFGWISACRNKENVIFVLLALPVTYSIMLYPVVIQLHKTQVRRLSKTLINFCSTHRPTHQKDFEVSYLLTREKGTYVSSRLIMRLSCVIRSKTLIAVFIHHLCEDL